MGEKIKIFFLQMISYFSIYEIGILLLVFFCFLLFFTLGLLLRGRRFIAPIFFFLSVCVIFSTPIVLQMMMTKYLYKIQVDLTTTHPMEYTKGFFVAGNITHLGKIAINECQIVANEVREENESTLMGFVNAVLPKSSYKINLDIDIEVGKSKEFAVVVPDFEAKKPFNYRIYVDCYLSNKLAQKMQEKSKKAQKNTQDSEETNAPAQSQETSTPPEIESNEQEQQESDGITSPATENPTPSDTSNNTADDNVPASSESPSNDN